MGSAANPERVKPVNVNKAMVAFIFNNGFMASPKCENLTAFATILY
jgi:hypothetical protein